MPPLIILQPEDRILVIHLAGIGDVILATPALHALRRRYPRNHIAILLASHAAHLLDDCPDVDAQWALTSTRTGLRWWLEFGRDIAVLQQLRAQQFALTINLYWMYSWWGSMRMAHYLRQIHPRRSLGYNTDGRGWCFTDAVPQSRRTTEQVHETAHALRLVAHAGCAPVDVLPRLWVTGEERARMRQRLGPWRLAPDDPCILLSPGAYRPDKRWPVERFIALGRWMAARFGVKIVVIGDAHDRRMAGAVARGIGPSAVNIAGETSLRESMALMTQACLIVSHDTGMMHMAAALQRPLVALFGPTNVTRFGPLGDAAHQRILQPPTCRLADLALADVQRAVEDLWGGARRDAA